MKNLVFTSVFALVISLSSVTYAGDSNNDLNAKAYSSSSIIVIASGNDKLAMEIFSGWDVADPGNINTGNVDAYFIAGGGKTSLYLIWGYTSPRNKKMLVKTIEYPDGMEVVDVKRSVLEALARQAVEKGAKGIPSDGDRQEEIPFFWDEKDIPKGI